MLKPTSKHITPTEQEIIELIAKGMSNPEIAEHLGRSIWTVKGHVKNILFKKGFHSRAQIIIEVVGGSRETT